MHANSSQVESAQTTVHPNLQAIVRRHLTARYQRPLSDRGMATFVTMLPWLEAQDGRPLILDSGCGTGMSTRLLAQANPGASVIGADRSFERLQRSGLDQGQALLIDGSLCLARINLEDLWPLLHVSGIRLHRHLLWYPNPSPKPEHLKRRWHAHPLFPTLLALRGEIELRSNWRVYVDEFAKALAVAGHAGYVARIEPTAPAVSPFERKYLESGHPAWRVTATLAANLVAQA